MISVAIALVALVMYLLFVSQPAAAPQHQIEEKANTTQETVRPVNTNSISIQNYTFNPKVISVPQDRTVIWTNSDQNAHTITIEGHTQGSAVNPSGSFSYVFDIPGTYTYYDPEMPNERGTIIVREN